MNPGVSPSLPPTSGQTRAQRRETRAAQIRRAARRSWSERLILGLLILAAFTSFGVAATFGYGLYRFRQIERVDVVLASRPPPGEAKNILVVGSDSRESIANSVLPDDAFVEATEATSGQRSDTIMVVRVDPKTESLAVLSFPRDLWLPIAGTDHSQRINTAYANGPQGLVDTIEDNFNIPIHHYVEVNFAGFAGLVDAIGGVPMWFDQPLRDRHSGLVIESAGCHVLDPEMALAYARSRHLEYKTDSGWSSDGTGDLGRITRQQVFLRRALDQVNDLGIGNLMTLNRLLGVAVHNTVIDRDLGLNTLLDLGNRFAHFEGNELQAMSLPVYPFRTSGGAAVLGLVEDEAQVVLEAFRSGNFQTATSSTTVFSGQESTSEDFTSEDGQGMNAARSTTTSTKPIGVAPDAEAACR